MVKSRSCNRCNNCTLLPLLDDDDILIDGGNTNYQDTIRRNKALAESGINFIGMGVSGGEVGALTGPSLMPGGQEAAYNKVSDILDAIVLKQKMVHHVEYIGPNGADITLKWFIMALNMQICNLLQRDYAMMKDLLGMSQRHF